MFQISRVAALSVCVTSILVHAQDPPPEDAIPKPSLVIPPTNIAQSIHVAAAAGDIDRIRVLLDRDVDVDTVDPPSKETPLLSALANNQPDAARFLLDRGARVDIPKAGNTTALHLAANWGHDDLVNRILDLGAKIDAIDSVGRAPLHYALLRGQTAAAKTLVSRGASPGLVDSFRNTPIDLALGRPKPDIILAMSDAGVKLTDDPDRAVKRIAVAARKDWRPVVRLILKQAERDPALRYRLVNLAFDAAVAAGRSELKLELVDAGADVDWRTIGGFTRLFQAAQFGDDALARRMLDRGADPNHTMELSGWTALHAAAQGGHAGTIDLLMDAGATPNAADTLRRTPLHIAAIAAQPATASALIRRGANPDAKDFAGNTPLHYASLAAARPTIDALIRGGASANIKNDIGLAAGDEAAAPSGSAPESSPTRPEEPIVIPAGFDTLVRALAPGNADAAVARKRAELMPLIHAGTPVLHAAIVLKAPGATLSTLLESVPGIASQRDRYGLLPLHIAAETGSLPALEILLDRSAPVNDAENAARWTPLHFAAAAGHDAAIELLRRAGANSNARDGLGRTPAQVAADMHASAADGPAR
jgi:ankyrin repeat protein